MSGGSEFLSALPELFLIKSAFIELLSISFYLRSSADSVHRNKTHLSIFLVSAI